MYKLEKFSVSVYNNNEWEYVLIYLNYKSKERYIWD